MRVEKKSEASNGVALAVAAAALFAASAGMSSTALAADAGEKVDLVHCYGVNVCKGHNDCKTSNNACKGHGACKGKGFVTMPSKSCGDIGGKTQDKWKGSVAKTDLTHCYGVNVCKGHNDCKGADNACAGKAACKGKGFVNMSTKACGDIGGKTEG